MIAFYAWLKKQKHRDDPIGDLSKDTSNKIEPKNTLDWWTAHLMYHNASSGARTALKDAWKEYVS